MLFVKKALGLALLLAPACVPGAADAGESITYQAAGGSVGAYFAKPADLDGRPGIVVVHHLWGLDAHTKSVADRFAQLGYPTVAPDLYRGQLGGDYGLAEELRDRLDKDRAVAIVKGAIGYLRSLDRGAASRPVGLVGFGMGGRIALSAALQAAEIQALVIFYGHVETTPEAVMPIQAPLLGVYGTDDRVVLPEEARKFESSLKASGKKATIIVYPGVAHAFFDDSRPDYDPELGKDAWFRTRDFLAEVFGPAPAPRPAAAPPAGASSTPAPPRR